MFSDNIDQGDNQEARIEKLRQRLNALGTAHWGFAMPRLDDPSEQWIDPHEWTRVNLSTIVVNDTGVTLEDGALCFPDDGSRGYWDIVTLVSWGNDDGCERPFRRFQRQMAAHDGSPGGMMVVEHEAPFYHPELPEKQLPTNHQVTLQAGIAENLTGHKLWLEVMHVADRPVRIMRSGIDAPLFMFARRASWSVGSINL